jgi:predicted membrane GTPase involved in stress response
MSGATTYTGTYSTFGQFVTGAYITTTALKNGSDNALSVFAANKSVFVKNAKAGDLVTVYGVNGVKVASSVLNSDNATLPLSAGIYMVKVGTTTTKVAVF